MALERFKNFLGIMGNLFRIGGPDGKNIKNNTNTIDFRNTADDDYVGVRAAHIGVGANANDVATQFNLKARAADIEFQFDGNTPPDPGDNTGKFGICHTTGGGYTAGEVYYDDGTSLILIPTEVCTMITTRTAIGGSLQLSANSVYVLEGSTWVNKSVGSSTVQVIEIPYSYSNFPSTISSSKIVPAGSRILKVTNVVDVAFPVGNPTLRVVVDGTSDLEIMSTSENSQKKAGVYDVEEVFKVATSNTGPISVILGGTAMSGGPGTVYVTYTTSTWT